MADSTAETEIKLAVGFGDFVRRFQVEALGVNGRTVRLSETLDHAFRKHDYPAQLKGMLSETMVLTAGLSKSLKFEGVFTLQVQGDGPVGLMISDVTANGGIRAYARCQTDRIEAALRKPGSLLPKLMGAGHMALTVDPGNDMDRYQGIVELQGSSLSECVQTYFRQSEQLETAIVVASEPEPADGPPRAAAIMIHRLPGKSETAADREADDDNWRRAVALLSSVTASEMLDNRLAVTELLFRLYHEDGVRVFKPKPLRHACRCSRQKVVTTLVSFPREEIEDMAENGAVVVTCEFCGTRFPFPLSEFDHLFGNHQGVEPVAP